MVLKAYRYVFFHAVSPNIAPTFPTNTELVGCLEGGEQKNFGSS